MKRLLLASALVALTGAAALADPPATGVVKDRAGYFPARKHAAIKGTAVGILLSDGQPILSLEGRSGPADQLVFSAGGNSYRWVYVTTTENPTITNLQVPVGDGSKREVYPALTMANPRSVLPWGVNASYSLVEVTVNSGLGSPGEDAFVATNIKVLDGTKDYPLKVADVIAQVRKRYGDFLAGKDLDKAMTDAGQKALGNKKATGPREKLELMYLTWLPETMAMQVRLRTKISDGAYTIFEGPGGKFPPRLPPQKGPGAADSSVPFRIIAKPGVFKTRTGTTFGIEVGQTYEVNKKGEIVRIDELPIESFTQQLNAQPVLPGPGPRPLPLEKAKPDLE